MSAKGQVVIPAALRKRHRLSPGRVLDVIDTPEGVLLRPSSRKDGTSVDEAIARIRRIIKYDGPPVTIDEMNESIRLMWAQGGPKDW